MDSITYITSIGTIIKDVVYNIFVFVLLSFLLELCAYKIPLTFFEKHIYCTLQSVSNTSNYIYLYILYKQIYM